MSERHRAKRAWFERWREHRRAKRQQAIEREYFEHERARASGITRSAPSGYEHTAPAAGWFGLGGGDGSGCGGDGGGC